MSATRSRLTPREEQKRYFQTLLNAYIAKGDLETEAELIRLVQEEKNVHARQVNAVKLVHELCRYKKYEDAILIAEFAPLEKSNELVDNLLERQLHALAEQAVSILKVSDTIKRRVKNAVKARNGVTKEKQSFDQTTSVPSPSRHRLELKPAPLTLQQNGKPDPWRPLKRLLSRIIKNALEH